MDHGKVTSLILLDLSGCIRHCRSFHPSRAPVFKIGLELVIFLEICSPLSSLQMWCTKYRCKNCKNSYIGETGRRLEIRIGEHKKEAMPFEIRQQTRATKIKAAREQQKSAITDHVISSGHLIDWDNVKVLDRESDRTLRWIKEAIWIRKSTPVMNRDEGGYQLSHIYDSLITVATSSGGHS